MSTTEAAEFCEAVRHRLVRALTLYCGDPWVAEELAQESLVRAWERWPRVRTMEAPEAWTLRVGTNLANSWYRRRAAERRARSRLSPPEQLTPELTDAIAVRAAVAALPDRQRLIVVARYFMDLSIEVTAATAGCAEGTVRATTHQALARLREMGLALQDDVEETR